MHRAYLQYILSPKNGFSSLLTVASEDDSPISGVDSVKADTIDQ